MRGWRWLKGAAASTTPHNTAMQDMEHQCNDAFPCLISVDELVARVVRSQLLGLPPPQLHELTRYQPDGTTHPSSYSPGPAVNPIIIPTPTARDLRGRVEREVAKQRRATMAGVRA